MALRQCTCGCWLADQLHRCPKCGKKIQRSKAADAEQEVDRQTELDRDVATVLGHKLRWVLPAPAQAVHRAQWKRLRKRFKAGDRNVRDNMRLSKAEALKSRAGAWSWEHPPPRHNDKGEVIITKGKMAVIYVSPKNNRYVEASGHEKPDLIIDYPKHRPPLKVRLKRWEKSTLYRQLKLEAEAEKGRAERKKAKKKQRKEKAKLKKRLLKK